MGIIVIWIGKIGIKTIGVGIRIEIIGIEIERIGI